MDNIGLFLRAAGGGESLEEWIYTEGLKAASYLLRNVSRPDGLRGAIVASPSRSDPDYYYHWVRDAGIATKAILLLCRSAEGRARRRYQRVLMDVVDFSRHIQETAAQGPAGLGEPKFTVDGAPYTGPWARPQDDGPAIRTLALVPLAMDLLDEGRTDLVREKLYDAAVSTRSVIKTDLEYLAGRWQETCFGPWEEVRGQPFFTRLLQRRALRKGAALAVRLGDAAASDRYLEQAAALGGALARHWDPARGYLVASVDQEEGSAAKRTGLDSAVVLATLGGHLVDGDEDDVYPVDHEQVLATAAALARAFASLYPINARELGIPGIAMGRYPEDRYDGYRVDATGNPWPCITLGFAAYCYAVAGRTMKRGKVRLTPTSAPFFQGLSGVGGLLARAEEIVRGDVRFDMIVGAVFAAGDAFMARVRRHQNPDGTLSEQMNRVTGLQQGAPNLTMAYAAFLQASDLRRRAQAGG
jgi:glucoamylase